MAAAGGEGFVVRVLDECGETWEETEDIGDAAVLVDAARQRGRVHIGLLSGFSSSARVQAALHLACVHPRGREATTASPSWW